ncbi:MAG: Uma2 family endonuclease [Methylocystis sp.]
MSALANAAATMTLQDFLAGEEPYEARWELVEGQPMAMAPTTRTDAAIQAELGRLIANALLQKGSSCSVLVNPGIVPRVRSDANFRVPDLGVVCGGYEKEELYLAEPVLLIEVLSPGNESRMRSNVWTYTTIPSVREIAIFRTETIGVELLRRGDDGNWPAAAEMIEAGDMAFRSIGVQFPLEAVYRTTRLAKG